MDWTKQAMLDLRRMRAMDVPASEIAKHLGTTKNAVLGKSYRLGLSSPAERRLKAITRSVPTPAPRTCEWGLGDPKEPGFMWCGEKTVSGFAYCARHKARAYKRTGGDDEAL